MSTVGPVSGVAPTAPTTLDVSSVSADSRRLASHANLEKAGKQFEAVFTQMMLKSMRSAHLAEGLFSSKAGDTFRDMQDQKLAQTMADSKPLGIGKAMVDFLAKSQPTVAPGAADSAADPAP